MSLSNISQVLLRNSDLLTAKHPLLVNLSADNFLSEYFSLYPESKITCFNTNFSVHQTLSHNYEHQATFNFSAQYSSDLSHDLVIMSFPKSKAELTFTLAMLTPYLEKDAQLLLVGEKNSGIKSSPKLLVDFVEHYQKIDSARHCMLFSGQFKQVNNSFSLDDWYSYYSVKIDDVELKIASLPGVFSLDGLDKGTELLLRNLSNEMTGKLLDFGCGAGVIACYLGKKNASLELSLLDVSALALKSAEETLKINNLTGKCIASDSLSNLNEKYDHIVSNPPFHQGVKTNYEATESFLGGIKKYINKHGSITIVANSFLQYLPIMEKAIGKTKVLTKENGFTLYQCKVSKIT
ncbi:methyltransferase [Colwelliaceae bacterium 6471]